MNHWKRTAAVLCAALAISAGNTSFAKTVVMPETQLQVLTENAMTYNGWLSQPARDRHAKDWRYAVTDLDHNGRLEILKLKCGWMEGGPVLICREIDKGGDRLRRDNVPVENVFDGQAPAPDLTASEGETNRPVVLYDAKKDLYHYIFRETVYHGEFESVTTKYALTLSEGKLYVEPLAHHRWEMSGMDGTVTNSYYLPAHYGSTAIDLPHYNDIEQQVFPECEVRGVALWWQSAEDLQHAVSLGRLKEALAQSYSSFAQ